MNNGTLVDVDYWDNIKTSKEFISAMVQHGITMNEIKSTAHGKIATIVVNNIFKYDQSYFDSLLNGSMEFWMTKYCIFQVLSRKDVSKLLNNGL